MEKGESKAAQGHSFVSTPLQSKKRPLAVSEGGLDIDFNATAATPSTAATTRGDSALRGNPCSIRLFREDSSAGSISAQTPVGNTIKRLPPLNAVRSPLPKLQASATTPTGEHAVYVGASRLGHQQREEEEEEEEEAPVTPQRKPGSSLRSRSPSPPKIDKYRSRCRPMPCDGIPPRRLATEFELMLDAGEEAPSSSSTVVMPAPSNFPSLMELPRLTFLYSDEEESDEDLISPGSRLPRMPRINSELRTNVPAGQPSTGRSTVVPDELVGEGDNTPSSTDGGHCMSLKESLVADLEALFLEMDQYQIPLRVASHNLYSRSAQYAEIEDMNTTLQEIVESHPQQFYLKGTTIHFVVQQGSDGVDG
ncbi:hypothetical protein Pmar_PMAR026258 [Perkinsus marinus ATCC 50983]|uniref:Uncharacterized protein n=1 Tax=Perkinsus marinus (strain ATCC 50983 / TXsc) TaxID=423536 RepID=C5LI47_PERM5|nr:hypothetical protein Pmar_PMAR026258 [Perkinsus marinus ATCC 50983]EER03582.1 hypothetical protein Pmar_PMAR026258 [Perkinsus marinus ATCC 50983]|eukprot:XP_002771766.1 hypothetical protein Pmar_PMAR026258 [Perkinsus marinus ATCC 50983]